MRYLIRNVLRDYPAFSVTEMVCTMPPRTSIKSHRIAFNIIVLWTVKYGRLRCGGRILIKQDRNSSFGGEGEGLRRPTAELKTLIITSYETRFRFTTNTVGWTGSIDHRAALHTSRIRMCGRRKSTADFQMVPKVCILVSLLVPTRFHLGVRQESESSSTWTPSSPSQYRYSFHFRINSGAAYLERGREARLVIDNVTYDYQGEYECRATNYINGQERTVPSEPVSLQVVGKWWHDMALLMMPMWAGLLRGALEYYPLIDRTYPLLRYQFNMFQSSLTTFLTLLEST